MGDQQQGFKQKWEALVEEKKRFLKEYEFEMLRRQPAEVSRQPSTVAQPPPTLQEKIWPPMPVTDPNVIQGQHKQLNQLDKTMKESISCPSPKSETNRHTKMKLFAFFLVTPCSN